MLQALVITLREGFEAFLIVAISLSYLRKSGRHALTSAVHWGIAVAICVSALGGYLLYHAANRALFLQVTAIFLFVFVVQLVIGGVHEMSEQRFLPFIEQVHAATESWGPDSAFGHLLSYLLVILPLGWLAIKAVFSKRPVLLPKKPSAPSLPDASSVAPRTQSALQ